MINSAQDRCKEHGSQQNDGLAKCGAGMLHDQDISERKKAVREFWDGVPCGTLRVSGSEKTTEFYEEIEHQRYEMEPFIFEHAQFDRWKGKKVLEVGCGTGTDLLQFLRSGSDACGIDLSSRSVALARKRLSLFGFDGGRVFVADAENLPFARNTFDLLYSWGVLHHTPDTVKALDEICRVLRPDGEIRIMLYHRRSLVALRSYLRFGVLRGRPFRSLDDIMAIHQESPGTKVYTREHVRGLFRHFKNLQIRTILTPYDLDLGDARLSLFWLRKFVPNALGFFLVIQGHKPDLNEPDAMECSGHPSCEC